jgi:Anti-sigma factor NepR
MSDKDKRKTSVHALGQNEQDVVSRAIARKLKSHYDDIAKQELPEQLARLLEELDRAVPPMPGKRS